MRRCKFRLDNMIIQKTPWLRFEGIVYEHEFWVFCANVLHELFDFPRESQIQLVAYSDRQKDSYLVHLNNQFVHVELDYLGYLFKDTLLQVNNRLLLETFYLKLFYKEYL